jgi:hypothetical protein
MLQQLDYAFNPCYSFYYNTSAANMDGTASPTQQNPLISVFAAANLGAARYLVDVPRLG